jgi:hypothetical protein
MSLNRCEQDLVGYNPQNSGAVLVINQSTLINDAVVIDTRAQPYYSGQVTLNIADLQGMTAEFSGTGTGTITLTVMPNQLLYVPIRVKAIDCGYDRFGFWQFNIYYQTNPDYPATTGGVEPEPCQKPFKSVKTCRFDAKIRNLCYVDFTDKLVELTGTGTYTGVIQLGNSAQCTGPLTIRLSAKCVGSISFVESAVANVTYTASGASDRFLDIVIDYPYSGTTVPFSFDYDMDDVTCSCEITATTTYENCNNPNLFTLYNGGTMSGYINQAQFNTAGVLARSSTVFTTTLNPVAGTALRATIASPWDFNDVPLPNTPVNPTALLGSIIWQGDITTPVVLSATTRYWLRCKGRVLSALHLILANEEVHLDYFNVAGTTANRVAIPYFSQYTPADQWHDVGIRFVTGASSQITPFVRYVNTFASGPFTTLTGDLYLNGGASSDWANVELTKYYPSDCIECPERTMTVVNKNCDYETILDLSELEACEEIRAEDNSLFGYSQGHSTSDFTLYRKLTVTLPDGNQQVYGSQAPYNILLQPASSLAPPTLTDLPITMGGYYEVTLCNVPTHRSDVSYRIGDNVVLLDTGGNLKFFKVLSSVQGFTPYVTVGWQTVYEEIQESELAEKYCDTRTYIQWCFLDDCINEYLNKLYCSIKAVCNTNICENECVQNYLYLKSVKSMLDGDCNIPNERDVLNYVRKICNTCNCQ